METVHGALCEYWTVVVHIKQGYVNSCVITSETFSRSGLLGEYLKQKKREKANCDDVVTEAFYFTVILNKLFEKEHY